MANCPNCGAPLAEDAEVCESCGASVSSAPAEAEPSSAPEQTSEPEQASEPEQTAAPEQTPEPEPATESEPAAAPEQTAEPEPVSTVCCPNCGLQTSADFSFCEHCGASLHRPAPDPIPVPAKRSGPGLTFWLIIGGVAAVAVIVAVLLVVLFSGGGGKKAGLYIKAGEIWYTDLSANGAYEATGDLGTEFYASLAGISAYSQDGKFLFYPDRVESDGSYTLYYREAAQSGKGAMKLDSSVTRYTVSGSAKLATYTKNGNLYQFDLSRGEKGSKISGDVTSFYASDDGKRIVYLRDTEGESDLYVYDGKESARIDSDVSGVASISADAGTMIYAKAGGSGGTLDLYLKSGTSAGKGDKFATDVRLISAYGTGAAYYYEEDNGASTLYYFDGKSRTELTDEFEASGGASPDSPVLVYQADGDHFIAVGANASGLNADQPDSFCFGADGKTVWFFDDIGSGDEAALYRSTISGGTAQKPEKYDDDVSWREGVRLTAGGHILYYKDYRSTRGGELYYDGKKADDDVYFIAEVTDGGTVYYVADYSAGRNTAALKAWSGGSAKLIADDVSLTSLALSPDGSILYLKDYSANRARGDLYVYDGSERPLDEDVNYIIAARPISDTSKYRWITG